MFGTKPILGDATVVDRDREFDQTAKTDTRPIVSREAFDRAVDMQCGNETQPRHVSPAIHEHRINVLEQEKRELTDALDREVVAHGKTQNDLNAANARIKQFEDFTRTLAAKCDQMIERCDAIGVDILDLPPVPEVSKENAEFSPFSDALKVCLDIGIDLDLPPAVETPAAVETHADGVREVPSNPCNQVSPAGVGRCVKARYHLGPCMTGAAA